MSGKEVCLNQKTCRSTLIGVWYTPYSDYNQGYVGHYRYPILITARVMLVIMGTVY